MPFQDVFLERTLSYLWSLVMSIFDLFKRDWKHSDPEKRSKALQHLDEAHQDVFADKATTDPDKAVRLEALKKLSSIDVIRRIADSDSEESIRKLAITRLYEEIAKHLKSFRGEPTAREFALVEEIAPHALAEEVYHVLSHPKLRLALVKKSKRQPLLALAATRDMHEETALAALENVQSTPALQEISEKSRHNSVRQEALAKWKAKRKQETVTPKAEDVLLLQCKALISQAERLAEAKPILAQEEAFALLMQEASKMDLGESKAKLDSLYNAFLEKVAIEKEKEALAEKERQALAEKQAMRAKLLEDWNALLQAPQTDENVALMQELKQKAESMVADADKAWVEKLQDLSRRHVKVLQNRVQVQETPKEVADNLGLKELLLELSNLNDSPLNHYTEKNLAKIKLNWEKLVNEDVSADDLSAFDSLVKSLNEKVSAWKEALEKEFAEKSSILKGLIDSVRAIEESDEDFREISQKLKAIKYQWKETVGEDKFRYQELWKEFLDATSRFQEMREWESWKNEKDKDVLLAELEKLSEETPSEELLEKAKKAIAQWKEIGPVSVARGLEYRDRYKLLIDKIFTNCASILEAKQEEREANLKLKTELTERVEVLLKDESVSGKDKYLEIKEIQEKWKAIGQVPKDLVQSTWERFRAAIDAFYALHKENLKVEDDRRQVNYEKKVQLCEEIEALKDSEDFSSATMTVKKLQEEWKSIGPVPKTLSDEIWNRFRTACDHFFNRRREHFEALDVQKQEHLKQKIQLCEKMETLSPEAADDVLLASIAEEWKQIGMVPKEEVENLMLRYMKAYSGLLAARALNDSSLAEKLQAVLVRKKEIIENINNLSLTAGLAASAEAVKALQVEWKALGFCGAEEENLYKEYHASCDEFFARRRDQLEIQEEARKNNLQKKQMLCEQAERLLASEDETPYNLIGQVKQLRKLWKEIGPVPREHSDKIWKHFNQTCDKVFAKARPQQKTSEEQDAESTSTAE